MAVKVKLNLPKSLWTAQDSLTVASDTLAMIKLRTSQGLDADRRPFRGYSTRPIYVSKRGARLAPKGGEPTEDGKAVFYEGGYKQYKHESRRRGVGDSAEVDLVLSGNMMNNLVVKSATDKGFVIGLTQHAQYGYFVNADREFLGLSDQDVDILVNTIDIELRRKL